MHPADARSQRSYPGRIDTYGRWLRGGPRWQRSDAATTPGAGMNRRFGHSYWSDKTGQGHDSVVPACGETQAAQFSRWGLERRCIPPEPPPHRENRAALRRSALRFGRNTRGIPPSRALSAGPPPGELAPPGELGLPALGAHPGSTTGWYGSMGFGIWGFRVGIARVSGRQASDWPGPPPRPE